MPGSGTSAFTEAGDFEAALREEDGLRFVVTGSGRFAARLTRITLCCLNLAAGEERLSRVLFVAAAADEVLMSFPIDTEARLIWGGNELAGCEIGTLGPGGRAHVRIAGPCRWGNIRLPSLELAAHARAMLGVVPALSPTPTRWRGPPDAMRRLREVHAAVVRTALTRPATLMNQEAVRGLEQQIIELVVAYLSGEGMMANTPARRRNQGIAVHLEELLRSRPEADTSVGGICAALGVSGQRLRLCCSEQLGVGPADYLRLRRLQQIRHALLTSDDGGGGLAAVAHRHGIRELRRFAAAYRAFYGELPSATLRRAGVRPRPLAHPLLRRAPSMT